MRAGLVLAVVVLLACPVTALAQARPTPPRDRPAMPTGTGVIRGRVVAADTGRPLRRVRVTITATELGGVPRNVSTDADGRYEVTELPAARFRVAARRSGYLPLQYGQRRPLELGKPLEMLEGQVVEHVDFALPRMGIITGRVLDDTGDPIEGVLVTAMRSRFWAGRRQLVPTGSGFTQTDDAGQYRLLGLAPDTYYVMASTRESWTVTERGVTRTMGFAPTYAPGTTSATDARRVTVSLGQEQGNVDVSLVPGRAAMISGTAFDSHGQPFANVELNEEIRGESFGRFGTVARATVAADGTFTLRNVGPGEYKLTASSGRGTDHPEAAIVPMSVDSVDVEGVSLIGSEGGSITGLLTTEDGTALPTRVRVTAAPPVNGQADPVLLGTFRDPGSGEVMSDGSFSIKGVFGRARLRVTLPDTWMVRTIAQGGRDLTDRTIELRSGETLEDVRILITKQVTTVDGQIADARGKPITEATVVIFADDAQAWGEDSRAVRAVRLDQQGRYKVPGLPPGDYLAVALEYVEDGTWNDPEFLESLRRLASKFTLAENGSQSLALKLATGDGR